jgi:hypothetical protein
LRPIRVISILSEGALVGGGDFWQFMVFFLKEGLQLGFACYFLMICKYFSAKLLD